MAALVDEWRTTLTSASTTKVYTERTCVWLVWCEQRRIEPLRVTWSNIACHLSQYAGDPLRRSAIRNFYKWLASTGRIESDPSMAPSVKGRMPMVKMQAGTLRQRVLPETPHRQ
jgi:site-specific recombinase XerD